MARTLALILVAGLVAVVPTVAPARTKIRVAIGDQHATMFDNRDFQRARFKRVRYLVPWNVMDNAGQRLSARAYVERARADGFQVLLHVSTDDYRIRKARRPLGGHLPPDGQPPGTTATSTASAPALHATSSARRITTTAGRSSG